MEINRANLVNLGVSFNAAYQGAILQAPSQMARIATPVNSTTGKEEYGWIGKLPNVRKWMGDRMVQNISTSGYTIKNEPWELTISVDRDEIEDDNLGIYGPMFSEMGLSTVSHKDQLTFGALAAGFVNLCFDGQPYFSQNHPVLDVNGQPATYSNTDAVGAGPAWFLMDSTRYLKPVIFQNRRPYNFVSLDKPDDENVFMRKEFIYGVDARYNVGYGFPQFCYGSTQPLTAATYANARSAMINVKGDYGRPIGVKPDLLVVPGTLESAGLAIVNAEFNAAGASNIWFHTAELMVTPWL